ncbi:glycosyltransferase family 2 protein [Shewanella sp. SR1]|uniref:glycosyltransferase family 2 protein n=1 Tax=Shewanella sp. SR1 TaxID=2855505 RepID=UPI001CF4E7A6|nr:glycosyltransferase family 2 protein [Shewanella sp. SR1]MCB2381938.1 glycosyltransferase family 2 protein [Shewanella sp. SR1]
MCNKVIIILATYNGAEYISEQLDSLLNQTHTNWFCYIFDDLSKDRTFEICREYQDKNPNKFNVIKRYKSSGSASESFRLAYNELLDYNLEYDFLAFCDQDDIWLENKLTSLINAAGPNSNYPILLFSDLIVVDGDLKEIDSSFITKVSVVNEQYSNAKFLSVDNIIPGCSLIINKPLVDLIGLMPEKIIMHDWWIVINALVFGTINYVKTPLVLYRQHANNSVGINDKSVFFHVSNFKKHVYKPFLIWKMLKSIMPFNCLQFASIYFCVFSIKVGRIIFKAIF